MPSRFPHRGPAPFARTPRGTQRQRTRISGIFDISLWFSRKIQFDFSILSLLIVLPIFSAFGTSGKGFVGRWRPGLRIPASSLSAIQGRFSLLQAPFACKRRRSQLGPGFASCLGEWLWPRIQNYATMFAFMGDQSTVGEADASGTN